MGYQFSKEELLRFANIFDNAGQVFLAGLVITPLISSIIEADNGAIMAIGIFSTTGCWFISWLLTKEANKWK